MMLKRTRQPEQPEQPETAGRRRPRPRRRGRAVAAGLTAVVVLAAVGVGTAHALQSSPDAAYRTAVVTKSSVDETLERSGTIEPVAQASVAFPLSGTVATVAVTGGATVTTGEVLATLQTTSAEADLTSKQATLAQDQLTVSQAVTAASTVTVSTTKSTSSSTSARSNASTSKSGSTGSTTTSTTTPSGPQTQVDPSLLQQATAVTTAQQTVDAALVQATAVVHAATQTCTIALASSAGNAACAAAEQAALTVQQQLAAAESNLATAEATLQGALNATGLKSTALNTNAPSGSSATVTAPTTTPPAHTTAATTGHATAATFTAAITTAAGTGSAGGVGASTGTPSAADLVADQAAVDADQAAVTAAQQNLAQATIVSPINGTVASIGLSVGQAVSAQSSTEDIIVVGTGGWEVATTVPVANIANVSVGDQAAIQADGISQSLDGKVVQIGVAATTSGTTTSYPVIVGFTGDPAGLGNGASATATISTAQATQVLTVPTSSVHSAGGFHYVTTLAEGKLTNTAVQIGAMGDDRTEIDSGLQAGQVVVLADLNAALPASNTTSSGTGLGAATAVRVSGLGGRGAGG